MSAFDVIPFFSGSNISNKDKYEKQCHKKKFKEGETIVDYHENSSDVGFILSGSLRILVRNAAGKEMIFGDFGEGKFIGEMSAIDGRHRSANVTAITNCEVFIVPNKVFCEICFHEPEISKKLLLLFSDRIRDLNNRLFERTVLDIRHRLYSELLRMGIKRKEDNSQLIISPPPYQHDIAARVGCRREQINRELNIMIEDQLLEKKRGGLIIAKPKVLEKRILDAMAGED